MPTGSVKCDRAVDALHHHMRFFVVFVGKKFDVYSHLHIDSVPQRRGFKELFRIVENFMARNDLQTCQPLRSETACPELNSLAMDWQQSGILICGNFPTEAHVDRTFTRHAAEPCPGVQLDNLAFFSWLLQSHDKRQDSQTTTRLVRNKSSFVNTRIIVLTPQAFDSSGFLQGPTWLRQSTETRMTAVI